MVSNLQLSRTKIEEILSDKRKYLIPFLTITFIIATFIIIKFKKDDFHLNKVLIS